MLRRFVFLGLVMGIGGVVVVACGHHSDNAVAEVAACTPVTNADFAALSFSGVPSCSGQMYAKYGDSGFAAVNKAIGTRALAAPTDKLGTSFQTHIADANSTRQMQFSSHLLQFLEFAYGNPNAYTGPTMVAAHKPLEITFAQYNYFLTDVVVPALEEVITDPNDTPDISKCFAPVLQDPNVIRTVVTCK